MGAQPQPPAPNPTQFTQQRAAQLQQHQPQRQLHNREQARQPQQQQQQQHGQHNPPTQHVVNQQTARSYAEAAKAAAQSAPCQTIVGNATVPHAPGILWTPTAAGDAAGQYAAVQPAGRVSTTANSQASAVVCHEIHSDAHDPAWEEDEELENKTVKELDPSVTDPNRILGRMRGVNRGIQKRAARLEKAKQDCGEQRQALEQAKLTLQAKEELVAAAEADLCFFKEIYADLAKKHTDLVQLDRGEKEKRQQNNQRLRTQQALWQAATTIRNLGEDPRIEGALAMLEALYLEVQKQPVQQQQQPLQGQQQAAPTPPAAKVEQSPAGPIGKAVATVALQVPTAVAAPASHSICPNCWSVSCRCPPASGARADSAVTGMEVDQERGSKRSCVEAALPERTSGGQPGSGALLVDSSGAPATPAAEEEELPAVAIEGVPTAVVSVQASAESLDQRPLPVPLQVEPERHAGPAATEEGGGGSSDSALPENYNKAPKAADGAEKEDSRKTFSALVKATCPQRVYPY